MIGICKILFDVCFYYSLSGFFLFLLTQNYPSVWGVPLLVVPAAIYMALKTQFPDAYRADGKKKIDPVSIICCALPAFLLLFKPTTTQLIHFLPIWAFLGFTLWNGMVNVDHRAFEAHFSFTGKLYGLLMFGVIAINSGRLSNAITGAIPYLILYLLTGVCLMRMLREEGRLTKGRNIIVLLILLAVSAALAGLQTPQMIISALGFLYKNVFSWILMGAAIGIGSVLYVFFMLIGRLFSFLKTGESEVNFEMEGFVQEMLGEEVEFVDNGFPVWLQVVGTILVVLAVALVVFLILRKLLGSRDKEKKKEVYSEEYENLKARERSIVGRMLRPKDPRLAVRWYYCKYLKEGAQRRGSRHVLTETSLLILRKYHPYFPGGEAAELREIYLTARYGCNKEIPKAAVDEASGLWSKIK